MVMAQKASTKQTSGGAGNRTRVLRY